MGPKGRRHRGRALIHCGRARCVPLPAVLGEPLLVRRLGSGFKAWRYLQFSGSRAEGLFELFATVLGATRSLRSDVAPGLRDRPEVDQNSGRRPATQVPRLVEPTWRCKKRSRQSGDRNPARCRARQEGRGQVVLLQRTGRTLPRGTRLAPFVRRVQRGARTHGAGTPSRGASRPAGSEGRRPVVDLPATYCPCLRPTIPVGVANSPRAQRPGAIGSRCRFAQGNSRCSISIQEDVT
jgi:hypothetical protein